MVIRSSRFKPVRCMGAKPPRLIELLSLYLLEQSDSFIIVIKIHLLHHYHPPIYIFFREYKQYCMNTFFSRGAKGT